jgi:hypothetical protein
VEWIGSLVATIINAGTRIYVAALIASSSLLFLPPSIIAQIGLSDFKQSYKSYIGAAFLVSLSLLLTSLLWVIRDVVLYPYRDRRERKKYTTMFKELTLDEKRFLVPFIRDGENTQYADLTNGIARGLEAKKIVYRTFNIVVGFAVPYNLQPIARRILLEKPEFLSA